jgi:hypothetical protein
MEISLLLLNFTNPPILFFILGAVSVLLAVNLIIPNQIAEFLSLYLLFSIGYNGGVELRHSGLAWSAMVPLFASVGMAILVPVVCFFILRLRLNVFDAGAISAVYGSVSAVTFITAINFLDMLSIRYGGFMVAALALMESPAIIVGLLLTRYASSTVKKLFDKDAIHEALFNSAVFLILGSMTIGYYTADTAASMNFFTTNLFKGMLSIFMLEMGIVALMRLKEFRQQMFFLTCFALFIPLLNALLAIGIAKLLVFSLGNAFLFTVLCASSSYIAVPAALRLSLPQANPGIYIPMSLGVTFPFNIIIGLPLYLKIIQFLW